ncbi:MAG: ABC transporter ATP-binding protein [Anaerolineaceae bacterium]|nr:ABC transporter ATP-binding protein [Anaerolineaceae bacterium]
MSQVEAVELSRYYGQVCALDELNLRVRDGELLVIVGPSGCGKTTLLRLIAGLDSPDKGWVQIGDDNMNGVAPDKRRVAMVFQSYALYPHMSVRKNIAFPLQNEGLPKDEIKSRVELAASQLDIVGRLERYPAQLSGGERQRVALARAIVRQPRVFLFDEPLSSLDAGLRRIARAELRRYQRRLGVTTLLVTHDQQDALSLGDRIAVMSEGRIRQIGTSQELYQRPADTFVATFLGSPPMNLIEKDNCIIGFRPEDFVPVAGNSEVGNALVIPVHVQHVEYLGDHRRVYGRVSELRGQAEVVATLHATHKIRPRENQTLEFYVSFDALNWFNRHTRLRMQATAFTHEGMTVS